MKNFARLPVTNAQELPYGPIHQRGMRAHGVMAGVINPYHEHVRCILFQPIELARKHLGVTHPPHDQGRHADVERRGGGRLGDPSEEVRRQIRGLRHRCCRQRLWRLDGIGTIVVSRWREIRV
jgi:hypothetical protein